MVSTTVGRHFRADDTWAGSHFSGKSQFPLVRSLILLRTVLFLLGQALCFYAHVRTTGGRRTAGFGVCPAGLELLLFSKIGKAEERRTLGKTEWRVQFCQSEIQGAYPISKCICNIRERVWWVWSLAGLVRGIRDKNLSCYLKPWDRMKVPWILVIFSYLNRLPPYRVKLCPHRIFTSTYFNYSTFNNSVLSCFQRNILISPCS